MVLTGRLESSGDETIKQEPVQPQVQKSRFTLTGNWQVETLVTDSQLETVTPGSVINSQVAFFNSNGKVAAKWYQPGWVDGQTSSMSFADNRATIDRTTYYFGDNVQGSWAAYAHDEFTPLNINTIKAHSYVDQYIDGHFLGRYHTVSLLKRISQTRQSTKD